MASIQKKGDSFYVVYRHKEANGDSKQIWEKAKNFADAKRRRAEIENSINTGSYIPPSSQTVDEFFQDFVNIYGEQKWGLSAYKSNISLIRNYISPILGKMKIQDITKRVIDKFYRQLTQTKPVESHGRAPRTQYLTPTLIEKIAHLMASAMKQAVRWDILPNNPTEGALLPKVEYKKREIWTADIIRDALDKCEDHKLYLAMNLSFACSLRIGEALGLTWNNVHITQEDILNDEAWIFIDKELVRVSIEAINALGNKDILQIFPTSKKNATTRLVLKKPKTRSSERKIWLPKTLAYILQQWKQEQDKLKEILQDDFADYGLVITHNDGRPCENRNIESSFNKLKKKYNLPDVVFHSLRHSSTTYKLALSNGNIKDVQGDTGHATAQLVTDVYSHMLDESRKNNAIKFNAEFYSKPDLHVTASTEKPEISGQDLLRLLEESPELKARLKDLLQ